MIKIETLLKIHDVVIEHDELLSIRQFCAKADLEANFFRNSILPQLLKIGILEIVPDGQKKLVCMGPEFRYLQQTKKYFGE